MDNKRPDSFDVNKNVIDIPEEAVKEIEEGISEGQENLLKKEEDFENPEERLNAFMNLADDTEFDSTENANDHGRMSEEELDGLNALFNVAGKEKKGIKKLKISDNFKKKVKKGKKYLLGAFGVIVIVGGISKIVHDTRKGMNNKQNVSNGITPGVSNDKENIGFEPGMPTTTEMPSSTKAPQSTNMGEEDLTPSITMTPTPTPTISLDTKEFVETFEDTQKLLVNRYDLDENIASSLLVTANASLIDENTFDTFVAQDVLSDTYNYANGYVCLGIDTFCEQRRDVYNGNATYGSIMCLSELFVNEDDKKIASQLDDLEKTLLTSTKSSEKASAYKEMLSIAYQTNKDLEVSDSIKYIYGLTTLDVCGMLLGEEGIVSQEILDEATLYMEQNVNPLWPLYQGEFEKGNQKTLN